MEENIIHNDEILIVDSSAVIHRKLQCVLYSVNYCCLCFEESTELNSVNQELEIIGDFGVHNVVLRDVVALVINNEIEDITMSGICEKCLNQIYNAYLFIRNTDYNLRIMMGYIDHIYNRAQEVIDLGNQEKLNISVCHGEINETVSTRIIAESGFKCSKCETVLENFDDLKAHENNHQWKFKVECKICKEFIYLKVYNEHLRMKHPDIAYSCPYCYSAYLTKRDYRNHLKRHELKKDLGSSVIIEGVAKCELCYKHLYGLNYKTHKCKFSCIECDVLQCVHYKYLIACHTQMVNRTRFRCPETPCKYVCKKKQQFIGHLNREHLDYHPYTCDICKQEFYSKRIMKKHIIAYHQETFICKHCCKDFSKERDAYKSHLVMCQSVERDFKCNDCEASFNKEEELLQHQLNCRRYCCQSCNLRFSEQRSLMDHRNKVHNGLQIIAKYPISNPLSEKRQTNYSNIICSECGVLCTKACIKTHMQENHPDTQAKFLCDVCEKSFKNQKNLLIHKQCHTKQIICTVCSNLVHEGRMKRHLRYHIKEDLKLLKGPQCSHCNYRVKSQALLETHVNQMHLKIKPYCCERCGKRYCGKIDLDRHVASHTRPKQIICEICSKPLFNNRSYHKHMAQHTGIKPFKCEQCKEAFYSVGELNYHRNKHKEKNIPCPISNCTTKFSLMTSMRSHFKKVHWKHKDKTFDPKLVRELDKQYYHLFEDKRCRKIVED